MIRDYASYFTPGPDSAAWGVALTASGLTHIHPHSDYPPLPPGRHPMDHLFTWDRGRVLHTYQVIYILDGQGTFESTPTGPLDVAPGTLFLLFPGVWHRYRPLRSVGWTESWIEISGTAVDRLARAGIISPRSPLHVIGRRPALEALLEECHRLAHARPAGFQPVLATLGLEILARLQQASLPAESAQGDLAAAVRDTQEILSTRLDRMINVEEHARTMGVSYSAFRHAFKDAAGISPKQFHLQMRLRKARDLLQNTPLPVGRIADALGFGSTFHFSVCFKKHEGVAPAIWRAQRTKTTVTAPRPQRHRAPGRGRKNRLAEPHAMIPPLSPLPTTSPRTNADSTQFPRPKSPKKFVSICISIPPILVLLARSPARCPAQIAPLFCPFLKICEICAVCGQNILGALGPLGG